MLAPEEFTVGPIGSAAPLSLVLPRNQYEQVILIGHIDGAPTAIFLTGQFRFQLLSSAGNGAWKGLVVPNVRVEVDEKSLFDADYGTPIGAIVRADTSLTIRGKSEYSYSPTSAVTLHDGLGPSSEYKVGFSCWRVVVGLGQDKRTLFEMDLDVKAENQNES